MCIINNHAGESKKSKGVCAVGIICLLTFSLVKSSL